MDDANRLLRMRDIFDTMPHTPPLQRKDLELQPPHFHVVSKPRLRRGAALQSCERGAETGQGASSEYF